MPPRGKELLKYLKDAIIKLSKENKYQRQIAKIIGKSPATVQKIIEKFHAEVITLNKPRTGRPPIFMDRERRIIVGNVKKNPKISAPKLTTDVKNNFAKSCNPETIRRVLRKARNHGRNMRRKPFVSKNFVIFSDESKFNIHGSDGHQKVWRKANTALEPKNMRGTVKHGGGSIMNNLIQRASKLGLDGSFTFQQDNDPKHTVRVVREWLLYNVR
ncbi:transposable element Tc1 transposase [Trichonephila clavipes]|nr:transposable element Tc1 transposase [Trichonephila clavipes]